MTTSDAGLQPAERVSLGTTGIQISSLGTGAWQWGDRGVWGYGKGYTDEDLRAVYQASLDAGINFFDTAELYGLGRSETLLGQFMRTSGTRPLVATKFIPFPWRLTRGSLVAALRRSLKRLGLDQVDLYQIHHPIPPLAPETWAEALADAVEAGLTRAVGVSNYSPAWMLRAHAALSRRGVPLASNQVQYSLLERGPERSGLLKTCQELNVTLIAYSPLAKGMLTGKYTPGNPPPGPRGNSYRRFLEPIQPLVELEREIGEAHGGKTPAQVALNWLICKGTVPIPGAKNARQLAENAGALGWRLAESEMAALDAASARLQTVS